MSGKSGLGGIPILPQNLLAVNEENPKVFRARILYIIIYLCLLGLFIAYAVINLIEFLDAQDNPALNTSVKGEEKLNYPVIAICPFFGNVDLTLDDVEITHCGSLETADDPKCGKDKGDKGDKGKKGNDNQQKLDNCYENRYAIEFPGFSGGSEPDYKDGYGCVIINLDQPVTDELINTIIDDTQCGSKPPTGGKGGKGKSKDLEIAYASGVGYYDRLEVEIKTKAADEVDTFSLAIRPSVEDFDIRTAEDAGNGFPENSAIAVFLRKVSFKCVDCDDDQKTYYYNATLDILSVQNSKDKDTFATTVQFYYDAVVTTELEEQVTTTTLDYLGNFAGMLGTLLGFAVINYLDRILCYLVVNQGGMSSVWDDYN